MSTIRARNNERGVLPPWAGVLAALALSVIVASGGCDDRETSTPGANKQSSATSQRVGREGPEPKVEEQTQADKDQKKATTQEDAAVEQRVRAAASPSAGEGEPPLPEPPPQTQPQEAAKPKPQKPPTMALDASAPPLKIAFVSYANPQQVAKDSQAVAKYLEQFVGVRVEGAVTTDYGSSVEAMRNDQADLAFVDPLAFMMAHEQIGAKPLLLEIYPGGKPTYYSCIWVRKDSGVKNLEDLKGKTIAFADQVDMSGHLLPREIFVEKGLVSPDRKREGEFFKQVYFAGGDEQAMRAAQSGFVDAAGISKFAYLLLRPDERDQMMVLARSFDSPSHLVMARKGLSDAMCDRIKQAMLSLDSQQPDDSALLDKLYGVRGYAQAKLSDFAAVAKVAARYGFVKHPESFASNVAP